MYLKTNNFMLLSKPNEAKIVKPNIKVIEIKKRPTLVDNKRVFDITLSAETVAPFVVLDFKLNSEINGHFIDNGFFIFDGKRSIELETESDLTEQQIKDNITVKTYTDII